MENFSTDLTYRRMELFTAADVVQHSFIVMNSISSLNLELCQSHQLGECIISREYYPSFSYSKDFINTQEKCRKILGNRDLVYNLHLDMPEAKDSPLLFNHSKTGLYFGNFREISIRAIPIVEIYIKYGFFTDILFQFVEYACQNNYDKLKILTWLIKFDAIIPNKFQDIPESILPCIADCMHPGLIDTEFVTKCLMKVDFSNWIRFNDKPERLANILYQVHRTGRNPKIMPSCNHLIVQSFFDVSFQNIYEVLKFLDAFKFNYFKLPLFLGLKFEFRILRNNWIIPYPVGVYDNRYAMLLLLLWFHIQRWRNPPAASKAVRLVWNSIPDSFLTLKEMTRTYRKIGLISEEIGDIWNFFCQAVGKFDSSVEPRSLQHYCRTTIRRIFWENNRWLPDSIGQTNLPSNLQNYLKLEM